MPAPYQPGTTQYDAGVLDSNGNITPTSRRHFISIVKSIMKTGEFPFPCGEPLSPLANVDEIDLENKQKYPDFHMIWIDTLYQEIARALNFKSQYSIPVFDPFTIKVPNIGLPDIFLCLSMPVPMLGLTLDIKLPDIPKFMLDLMLKIIPTIPTLTIPEIKIPKVSIPDVSITLPDFSIAFPPFSLFKLIFEFTKKLPTLFIELSLEMLKIEFWASFSIPSLFGMVCKKIRDAIDEIFGASRQFLTTPFMAVAAFGAFATVTAECIAYALVGVIIGTNSVAIEEIDEEEDESPVVPLPPPTSAPVASQPTASQTSIPQSVKPKEQKQEEQKKDMSSLCGGLVTAMGMLRGTRACKSKKKKDPDDALDAEARLNNLVRFKPEDGDGCVFAFPARKTWYGDPLTVMWLYDAGKAMKDKGVNWTIEVGNITGKWNVAKNKPADPDSPDQSERNGEWRYNKWSFPKHCGAAVDLAYPYGNKSARESGIRKNNDGTMVTGDNDVGGTPYRGNPSKNSQASNIDYEALYELVMWTFDEWVPKVKSMHVSKLNPFLAFCFGEDVYKLFYDWIAKNNKRKPSMDGRPGVASVKNHSDHIHISMMHLKLSKEKTLERARSYASDNNANDPTMYEGGAAFDGTYSENTYETHDLYQDSYSNFPETRIKLQDGSMRFVKW
jgi:hypothetical protein